MRSNSGGFYLDCCRRLSLYIKSFKTPLKNLRMATFFIITSKNNLKAISIDNNYKYPSDPSEHKKIWNYEGITDILIRLLEKRNLKLAEKNSHQRHDKFCNSYGHK